MLLDMTLVAVLLEDELDIELDGCDETSDELLLVFPVVLEELIAPEPPLHAHAIADIHATASINRSLCVFIAIFTGLTG